MDETLPAVIDDINETRVECANTFSANANPSHITGVELSITGVNNAVDKVPAFTKESQEEYSDEEDDNTSHQ